MASCSVNQDSYPASIVELVRTLDSCRALIGSSDKSLRIFPVRQKATSVSLDEAAVTRCNDVLQAIGERLQLPAPQFVWPAPHRPSSLETALSRFCSLDLEDWNLLAMSSSTDSLIANLGIEDLPASLAKIKIKHDGQPDFEVSSQGIPGNEAIIFVPPCGVPVRLFQPWIQALAAKHFVVTLEDPFLFGDWRSLPEPSGDISVQVARIGAVLQAFDISHAHLIGICGGAPIALSAGAHFGNKIASLVLCHGDLNFGPDTPRTPFQEQFEGLLGESAQNIRHAKENYSLLLDPSLLVGVPDQLGPFILYPYADLGLFHRYAKVNAGLMAFNGRKAANALTQPLMIITSRDDRMTHPGSSHMLREIVRGSHLLERETGNHQDMLLENPALSAAILEFIHGIKSDAGTI